MTDDQELLGIGERALARVDHGEAEVMVVDERSELTRFAGNEIHQSVAEQFRFIRVRLVHDGRTGVGEVRGHGADAVERAMTAAEESRRVTTAPDASPLPPPDGAGGRGAFAQQGQPDRIKRPGAGADHEQQRGRCL